MTIVEAAFALPILLTFIFGLVDLGMWTFNANQATNAARDGARLGILDYRNGPDGQDADDEGSVQWTAIADAVGSRLEEDKVERVDVTCVDDAGGELPSCAAGEIDVDSIRVEVEWSWDLITPVAAVLGHDQGSATGSATMKLVGRPLPAGSTPSSVPDDSPEDDEEVDDETPAPSTCAVTSVSVPASVDRKHLNGNGTSQLADPVLVEFVTNGSAACTELRVQLESPNGSALEIGCGCDYDPPKPPEHRWSYDGSNNIWKPGTAEARVLNGATVLASKSFFVN